MLREGQKTDRRASKDKRNGRKPSQGGSRWAMCSTRFTGKGRKHKYDLSCTDLVAKSPTRPYPQPYCYEGAPPTAAEGRQALGKKHGLKPGDRKKELRGLLPGPTAEMGRPGRAVEKEWSRSVLGNRKNPLGQLVLEIIK